MKKIIWITAFLLTFGVLLTACSSKPNADAESNLSSNISVADGTDAVDNSSSDAPPRIQIADAALYRGSILKIEGNNLVVEQCEGRNYGEPQITFMIDENTDLTAYKTGDYVEVYYGALQESAPAQANAIALNKISDTAAEAVFNGEITKVVRSDSGDIESLELKSISNSENTIVFHISAETQFYLNAKDLKEGDKISVYFGGALTKSIPPQGTALEVSPYTYEKIEQNTDEILAD